MVVGANMRERRVQMGWIIEAVAAFPIPWSAEKTSDHGNVSFILRLVPGVSLTLSS